MNPGPVETFSLLISLGTEERFNPSPTCARDFANAVGGEGLSLVFKKTSSYPGSVLGFPRFSLRPAEDDLLEADEGRLEEEAANDGQRRRHEEVAEKEVDLKMATF